MVTQVLQCYSRTLFPPVLAPVPAVWSLSGGCVEVGEAGLVLYWGSDFGCLSPCLEVRVSVLVAILPRAPSWLVQGDPRPRGQGQCVFPVGCWC